MTEPGHISTPPTDGSDRVNQLKTAHVLSSGEAVRVDVSCKAVKRKKEEHHLNCEFQVIALNHLPYKTVQGLKYIGSADRHLNKLH